jgi:hypothetical protein
MAKQSTSPRREAQDAFFAARRVGVLALTWPRRRRAFRARIWGVMNAELEPRNE